MTVPGSRRQAVRRRFVSISARLLHSTILDFRLRLGLLAALTLPCILLGGLVHALVSGQPWTTSVYLVYGLLFRVPALGAVRLDEPSGSAVVLNVVFLFGTFVFALLLGLIGEEVKGTVKALRAGGAPLDLTGHVVLLNFTPDATAVALLRQLAEDVSRPESPLYGRPVVVLASPPPLPDKMAGGSSSGGGGSGGSGGGGGGGGDLEGTLKRLVADALQGRGACEWHLRVGCSCRPDDLARVCAATAAYLVLLADPRVGGSGPAAAAGAAACLQAQALMCLSLSLFGQLGAGGACGAPPQPQPQRGTAGGAAGGASSTPVAPTAAAGGGGAGWGRSRGRTGPTIVVQSPADGPHPPHTPGASGGGGGGGPIATFRALAAAEGTRAAVIEVRDRGIVDRLVAQTVLQPGVATVLARLFGSSGGGEGTGFRWVAWPGMPTTATSVGPTPLQHHSHKGDVTTTDSPLKINTSGLAANAASPGVSGPTVVGAGAPDAAAVGLRRRHTALMQRALSYGVLQRSLSAVASYGRGGVRSGAREADRANAPLEGPFASSSLTAAVAAAATEGSNMTTPSVGVTRALPSGCTGSTFGEVRQVLEAAVAAAAASATAGSRLHRRHRRRHTASPPVSPSPSAGAGVGAPIASLHSLLPAGVAGALHGSGGCVCVGYLSAATGTLRLNPSDASPVYPGDQLVLLVSDRPVGRNGATHHGKRHHRAAAHSSHWRCWTYIVGLWSAWVGVWGGRSRGAGGPGGSSRCSQSTTMVGSDPAEQTNGANGEGVLVSGFDLPPLQSCHSDPQGSSTLATFDSEIANKVENAADKGKDTIRRTSSCMSNGALQEGAGEKGEDGGDGGGGGRPRPSPAVRIKASPPRIPPPAAATPSHTIVISRTPSAVRGVLAGLQEFAPAGTTIALLTHGSVERPDAATATIRATVPSVPATPGVTLACTPAANRTTSGLNGGAGGTCNGSNMPYGGASGSSCVVLPYPCTTWPVSEEELMAAGLSMATAVLVARDNELQPNEADATAMGAVLQIYQTLTDPTRSPLRRAAPPPITATATDKPAATANLETVNETLNFLPAAQSLTELSGRSSNQSFNIDLSQHPHHSLSPSKSPLHLLAAALDSPRGPIPRAVAGGAVAGTAAGGGGGGRSSVLGAGGGGGGGGTPPLHVVVCLHSTRARETLRGFMARLSSQPPFTLEVLVPEEYRALLLAGVVRQPQSVAIMTDLLSDRPGAPEVYLVPPARLRAAASAASGEWSRPVTPTTDRNPPHNQHRTTEPRPYPAGSHLPGDDVRNATPSKHTQYDSCWQFADVSRLARACGCTALGVLRGDAGEGFGVGLGKGGCAEDGQGLGSSCGLELAPSPDTVLSLGPRDRLVVLAADPV